MRFLLFLALVSLVGCAGDPLKSYMITPDGPVLSGGGKSIGIGPVLTADYLVRVEIPVETSQNEMEYSYDHLWAGSVEKQLSTAIGANLSRRERTGAIYHYPWDRNFNVRYQVSLDVRRFHSTVNGLAILETGWRVYDLQEKRILAQRSSYFEEPFAGEGFRPAMAALSQTVSDLSDEISRAIP